MHSVDGSTPPDTYFLPCVPCMLRHGFDAVEAAMKRRKAFATETATEEAEDFRLCLPTSEAEREVMDR